MGDPHNVNVVYVWNVYSMYYQPRIMAGCKMLAARSSNSLGVFVFAMKGQHNHITATFKVLCT